jgi:glycosyltransferase involved in cell wall biosynthesis
MKKLLVVMNDFVSGGCETQIFNLYRGLRFENNYEFTFLYLGKLNQNYYSLIKTEFGELKLIHFDGFLVAKTSLDFYFAYFKLYRLLKRGKFDVIIPFHRNTSIIFGVINFFLRKKCFFQERGGNLNLVSKISKVSLYLLKRSKLIFVANNFKSGEILSQKLNINSNRVNVIYNGIANEKNKLSGKSPIEKLTLNENTKILTFVANYYPEKEHEFLINSIYEFGNLLTSNIVLLLVGNDNGSGRLNLAKSLVQKLNLNDKIKFIENLYDVQSVYEITDLALFCSKSEGLANVLIEYLKFELPIIASRIPVFEEVLGENYPYFYDLNDGKGLVIKIEEVLAKNNRKEDAKRFSQTQMHKFDLTKMINSYKQLIDEG